MQSVVVVGAQWGDEGKGKVVDVLTEHADLVVRYAGGPNAGHTLVVDGERIVVRLVPSGVLRPRATCVLAQGTVVDVPTLLGEMDDLVARGVALDGRFFVSDRAHLILPHHVVVDGLREAGTGSLGTTKRGVGPAYEDKVGRRGLHIGLLARPEELGARVAAATDAWAPWVASRGGVLPAPERVTADLLALAPRLLPYVRSTGPLVASALAAGQRVLFEGAQGALLDVDHGTYPFVTSSTTGAAGASSGAGVGPRAVGDVLGLVKAYTTRVGLGPFPTELHDAVGEGLRRRGAEFGSVTGRPRRCGWLDLPALKYAVRVNGIDRIALTKLDVLAGVETLHLCVAYEVDGERVEELPIDALDRAVPIYETFPGFSEDVTAARTLEALPAAARAYVDRIVDGLGVPLAMLSVGPGRDETLVLSPVFS